VRLADVCDVDLAAAARRKLDKNGRKYPADRVNGSSAKYTAYAARDTQAGGLRPPEQ
jgi:dCTP diphosphatase